MPLLAERWAEYRDLRLESLLESPQAYGSSHEGAVGRPDEYWIGRLEGAASSKPTWLLFAEVEDGLVGMIGADIREENAAVIISMYVRPDYRGRGIARQLLDAIMTTAAEAKPSRYELLVNKIQAPALALYAAAGFVVAEEFEAEMGDGLTHTECRMIRPV